MATISELNSKIANAKNKIKAYKEDINEANLEISNCEELKRVLDELSSNASNCSLKLGSVYSSLSAGISTPGINSNISKVSEKSRFFSTLSANAQTAKDNAITRIEELNLNIEDWNDKIKSLNSSISRWESQKSSLWTKLHSFVSNEKDGE